VSKQQLGPQRNHDLGTGACATVEDRVVDALLLPTLQLKCFSATLNSELLHRAVWRTRQLARTAIFRYIGLLEAPPAPLHAQLPEPRPQEADYLAAACAASKLSARAGRDRSRR
jgi:hypothetical protein